MSRTRRSGSGMTCRHRACQSTVFPTKEKRQEAQVCSSCSSARWRHPVAIRHKGWNSGTKSGWDLRLRAVRTEVGPKPQNWMKIVQRVEREESKKMVLTGATFQEQPRGETRTENQEVASGTSDGRPYSTSPFALHVQGLACNRSQCADAVGSITVTERCYFPAH